MNGLKNILLVIALFLVALPCTHAESHQHGAPFAAQPDQISAIHACECHSCDEDSVCTEPLEVTQELTVSTTVALQPTTISPLFILNQSQPDRFPVAPSVAGTLARLTTIQLLI